MTQDVEDRLFERFRRLGDARALAQVFDRCAPELYRVAFHLVGDSASAEDMVQSCFVEVIEHRERYRHGERLMPWMLGILANLARRRQRSLRPVDPTRLTLRDAQCPLEAAEATELHAELRLALKRLPDTYRELLVLHLLHGLKAGEIAEALNRPAGSVRTQLLRGMDQLRRALPASLAGGVALLSTPVNSLAGLRAKVLSEAGVPAHLASSFAVGLFGTVFTMKKFFAAAAVLVLALSLSLIPWMTEQDLVSMPDNSQGIDPSGTALPQGNHEAEKAKLRLAAETESESSSGSVLRVQARYGGDNAAAADVRIYVVDGPANNWRVLRERRSDANGLVEFKLPPGQVYLRTDRGTRVTAALPAQAPGEIKITIPVGMDLRGRCVDAFGNPLADAAITVQAADFPEPEGRILARSAEDGSFLIREIESPMVNVWATHPGRRRSQQQVLWGGEGSKQQVELVLAEGACVLTGQVFNRNGSSLAEAIIYVAWKGAQDQPQSLVTRSDAAGQYHLPDLWPGPANVFVHDQKNGRAIAHVELQRDETQILNLQIAPGATLHGVIMDQHGRPWGKQNIVANWQGSEIGSRPSGVADQLGLSEDDGSYRMEGLLAGHYRLSAGWASDRKHESLELVDGQTREWNPIIPRGVDQAIRLLDLAGEPLAGWRVTLLADLATGQAGPAARRRPAGQGNTDAEGRVVLHNLMVSAGELIATEPDAGPLQTFGQMGSLPTLEVGAFQVNGEDQELRVDASNRPRSVLAGRLSNSKGEALPGVELVLHWEEHYLRLRMRSREDGSFRFTRLAPGAYELLAMRNSEANFETMQKFEVDGSEELDLGELSLPELCEIRFYVTGADGKPVRDLALSLLSGTPPGILRQLHEAGEGTYSSSSVKSGPILLQVTGPTVLPKRIPFELEPGQSLESQIQVDGASSCTLVMDFEVRGKTIYGELQLRDESGTQVLVENLHRDIEGNAGPRIELIRGLPRGKLSAIFTSWTDDQISKEEFAVPASGGRIELQF